MRSFVGLQTCIGLLVAFLLAPFQHVHQRGGTGPDHDYAGTIHAHFYRFPMPVREHHGRRFEKPEDDHETAWQLDTFKPVLAAGLTLFILSGDEPAQVLVPPDAFEPVALVEACGHDPPAGLRRSIPRAPPAPNSGNAL